MWALAVGHRHFSTFEQNSNISCFRSIRITCKAEFNQNCLFQQNPYFTKYNGKDDIFTADKLINFVPECTLITVKNMRKYPTLLGLEKAHYWRHRFGAAFSLANLLIVRIIPLPHQDEFRSSKEPLKNETLTKSSPWTIPILLTRWSGLNPGFLC